MPPRSSPHDSPSALIGLFVVLIMFVFDHPQEVKVQGGGTFFFASEYGRNRGRDDVKSTCSFCAKVKSSGALEFDGLRPETGQGLKTSAFAILSFEDAANQVFILRTWYVHRMLSLQHVPCRGTWYSMYHIRDTTEY